MPRFVVLAALSLGALAACGDDGPSAPSPTGTTVSIVAGSSNLTTTAYAPNPVTISVGGTITWVNNDAVAHTSTSTGQWDSGTIQPGGRFSRTFQTAGSFPYLCTIHPNMVGTVTVQ